MPSLNLINYRKKHTATSTWRISLCSYLSYRLVCVQQGIFTIRLHTKNMKLLIKYSFCFQFIQNTMNRTRIYVFLGTASSLVEMMTSMDTVQLFSKGEYLVIFVDMMTYSPRYVFWFYVI